MLVTFLHTPSVAFDYEAEVTAVAMDPTVKRKREGKHAHPHGPWTICNCTPPTSHQLEIGHVNTLYSKGDWEI